jgi:hypothetical protein
VTIELPLAFDWPSALAEELKIIFLSVLPRTQLSYAFQDFRLLLWPVPHC